MFNGLFDSFLAAQPLHWVYDLQRLEGILAQEPSPEFRSESANPFYRRQTGQQSCYGDQAFVLLESLSECGGGGSSSSYNPDKLPHCSFTLLHLVPVVEFRCHLTKGTVADGRWCYHV